METDLFKKAESLLWGNYYEAFIIFEKLATSEGVSKRLRADSYAMMGTIVSVMAPELGDEDEYGFSFFKRALSENPLCLNALMNLVAGFSLAKRRGFHSDIDLFRNSYHTLLSNHFSGLDTKQQELLLRKGEEFSDILSK